ncbi:hypothetical protein DXG01_000910 [Tephrocybe rancida]|nr:hypothetical protein DXG01_000910 [Tephrocybe rancida]
MRYCTLAESEPAPAKTIGEIVDRARAAGGGEVNAVTGVELDLADFTDIRFGQDRRLEEVARMLYSSKIPNVKTVECPELKVEFSIQVQPANVTVTPEPGKTPLPEYLNWGDFHNGVAAEFMDRIQQAFGVDTRTFGFLFGLGLTGHLKEMPTWHTFGYLTLKHDLTSIGVLLGLSAAKVGSSNTHVTKLLAVHTPALLVDLN